MRFIALVRKELREALPWICVAFIVMLIFGALPLEMQIRSWHAHGGYNNPLFEPGKKASYWHLSGGSAVRQVGPTLLLTSLGLGFVLAGRQFWFPRFTKTWAFTIHRSVSGITILCAKFFTAAIGFLLGIGILWILLFLYASKPGRIFFPPHSRVFEEGWIFISLGFIAYLGICLKGLSKARWYATGLFGPILSVLILILVINHINLMWCWGIMFAGVLILLPQIIHSVINGEF